MAKRKISLFCQTALAVKANQIDGKKRKIPNFVTLGVKASQTDGKTREDTLFCHTRCGRESDLWQKGKIWLFCQTTLGVKERQIDGKEGKIWFCQTTLGVNLSKIDGKKGR